MAVLAQYAARFSVRAHDVTVDATLLWVGGALAVLVAIVLAFVPRLPSAESSNGIGLGVGVAGVLAFSVSARTREFGVRLAIGSTPTHLLTRVLKEGAAIGILGIVAGAVGGVLLARVVGTYVSDVQIPGLVPIAAAAIVLIAAAILASVTPAVARASRVTSCALRSE